MPESTTSLAPIVLDANQPLDRPYRGGAGIARFRGIAQISPYTPEDFVASTTEVFSGGGVGLTVLPSGTTLRDAVAADPLGYLGPEHLERLGASTMLLTKLLNTGERLFVHYHPDDAFAQSRLGRVQGKTEAWVVLDVEEGQEGYAALGFSRAVSEPEVEQWFSGQDAPDMLGAMNRIPLSTGDTLLVPAGLAHAIGPGLTLVELQQPTDLSVILEYAGYNGLDPASALLGLDPETAFAGLDRRAWDAEQLAVLRTTSAPEQGVARLFPEQADRFFAAERITVAGSHELEPSFSVLIVIDGAGALGHAGGSIPLTRGTTVLVPYGAGSVELTGALSLVRALPPRGR
ncbi:MAG TPA: class I mannose-6-phosphate isomerase [Gryllotalpicola sp.]